MNERTNFQPHGCCKPSDPVCCITANKVFDSARDKDYLDNIRVCLCEGAQELIDNASAIRCKRAELMTTDITIDPVPFNRGCYQVLIRYYFCIVAEVCVENRPCEVKGIAVYDKKVILYGSEKNVSVFTSDPENNGFCKVPQNLKCESEPTLPTVVVEVAAPVCLDLKLKRRHHHHHCDCYCGGYDGGSGCGCGGGDGNGGGNDGGDNGGDGGGDCDDGGGNGGGCNHGGHCGDGGGHYGCSYNLGALPDCVKRRFDGCLCDCTGEKEMFVSLGIFSVIRMERPVQIVVPASRFCLPDKDSTPAADSSSPCKAFGRMSFPMDEFFPYADDTRCACGGACGGGCGGTGGGNGGGGGTGGTGGGNGGGCFR